MSKLIKLSKEFAVHCGRDLSKICILLPKYVLSSLNVWPDTDSWIKKWLVIVVIINLGLMEFGHLMYVLFNLTDIPKMATAATTVLTTGEAMIKLGILIYLREPLNLIIRVIWYEFWPAELTTSPERLNEIKWRSRYVISVASTFLLMAYISNAQFMAFPLIANSGQLPLSSWFPFHFTASPLYEMMYIWQWFLNQVVITTLSGFDALFNALVMICATQFQILQDVLENMNKTQGNGHKEYLFKDEKVVKNMMVLVKCVKHHLKLIKLCTLIERTFTGMILVQFAVSAFAICISCVGMVADQELFQNMFSYFVAHLLQFFIYCSVGNELTYQSGQVANAAYDCDWHLAVNETDFIKGLMMLIRRAQKPQKLTVSGLLQLSFENFVATVKFSFSFYVLLKTFI